MTLTSNYLFGRKEYGEWKEHEQGKDQQTSIQLKHGWKQ